MRTSGKYAVVVPMANEEPTFDLFTDQLTRALNAFSAVRVYLVTDNASKDRTREQADLLSSKDARFVSVYAPDNKNVVDAYLAGDRMAFDEGAEFIVEMDGGLSHDPSQLPQFFEAFERGFDCVFGSRFIPGGKFEQAPFKRKILSRGGTMLSNLLLGTRLKDMTSGFQGYSRAAMAAILEMNLRSTGHFYQTEIRYLLRKSRWMEIPITYASPSPRLPAKSIWNAVSGLLHYAFRRLTSKHDIAYAK